MSGAGGSGGRGAEATAALFVRIPTEHARRLDRAAFELQVPKQSLVSGLVERYVDPDSPASLRALAGARAGAGGLAGAGARAGAAGLVETGGGRRVTVETLDQGELTVGRHAFRPAAASEVLTAEDAAELLQVSPEVVLGLARAGELPGRDLGGEWRFARAALLGWLAAGEAGSTDGESDGSGAGGENGAADAAGGVTDHEHEATGAAGDAAGDVSG
ncbi:MAG TPA: helix-turn-helix domain-containing protein [Solirubrobacteraceae bacterium]|nr:helix-turn-helix domain-containing protein [Solirubrobacteraceae bacterium]